MPDRSTRPRVVLALASLALLGAAVSVWLLLPGARWSDQAVVEVDGAAHEVEVGSGPALLWSYDFHAEPSCVVRDAATDDVLQLEPADTGHRRDAGSVGDWVGTLRFESPGDVVAVACDSPAGLLVAVTNEPRLALYLPVRLGLLGITGAVGLLGLAAALAAVVRTRAQSGRSSTSR